ncbi:exonuclease V subunit beta [Ceratobasidium sp. AG-Ba]|nr:exonuclease V subunit beta [Ceratobasidium sp. AG-Ba]
MLRADVHRVGNRISKDLGSYLDTDSESDSTSELEDPPLRPLRIFYAEDVGTKYVIPETEDYTEFEEFGEKRERHVPGTPGNGRRTSLSQLAPDKQAEIKSKMEYITLCETRRKRVLKHPVVEGMMEFGWFSADDILRPDGTALLQEVWQTSHMAKSRDTPLISFIENPERAVISGPESTKNPVAQTSFACASALPSDTVMALKGPGLSISHAAIRAYFIPPALNPADQGGILTQCSLVGQAEFTARPFELAHQLWLESAKCGSKEMDETYE